MKTNPKIALIVTSEGLECVTLLSNGEQEREKATEMCQLFQQEITMFDLAIRRKLGLLKDCIEGEPN